MQAPPRVRRRGFTLIELLVVIAALAILTAIAYPSYASYVRKAKRATAQAALMDVAGRQQAYLLDRRAYATTLGDLKFSMPQEINGAYAFTLAADNAATPMTFLVTATPAGSQASGGEQALSLNQAGTRTPAGTTGYWGQ